MPREKKKESVISRLRKQLEKGRLTDDVSVVYRVQGGTHGEHTEESVVLSATGGARVRVSDALGRKRTGEARELLGREAVLVAVRELGAAIDDLVPQSEARFVPDSLVGSVTIGIGDETETYYFLADEEAYEHEGKAVPAGVRSILECFGSIEEKCLARTGGGGPDRRGRLESR